MRVGQATTASPSGTDGHGAAITAELRGLEREVLDHVATDRSLPKTAAAGLSLAGRGGLIWIGITAALAVRGGRTRVAYAVAAGTVERRVAGAILGAAVGALCGRVACRGTIGGSGMVQC